MILVDISEPDDVVKLLSQTVPVSKQNLNQLDMSDYFFWSSTGERHQFSRKQAGELLGSLDTAEKQIQEYYNNAEHNYQIVEGIISPCPLKGKSRIQGHDIRGLSKRGTAMMYSTKVEPSGYMHDSVAWQGVTPSMYWSWLNRLSMAGVQTYFPITWSETAKLLAAIWKNEQKSEDEHYTLQRIIVPKIHIKEKDSFVKSLVYLSNIYRWGIGETKALEISKKFHSLLDIVMADREELCQCKGVSREMAEHIQMCLGKEI
jgi:hypothetical protein